MFANTKNEWKSVVKRVYGRKIFKNYDKSVDIFKALGYDQHYKDATILDCYPSAAVFSAASYNTIQPKQHVFFEPFKTFNSFLSKQTGLRTHVTALDPYRWDTFQTLENQGVYHIEEQPYKQVHNQLLFMANLSHAQGEQLCAQYLNCIMNRSWIMRHGRIRLLMWLRASTAEKLLAGPGEKFRNRIGVQRESCCDARVVLHDKAEAKKFERKDIPYPSLLENPMFELDVANDLEASNSYKPLTLVELTPKEHQIEHIDHFEYVNRMIFYTRSTPLAQSLNNLGHGAIEDLGPKLTDILHKLPTELSGEEIKRITNAFWEWPFRPTFLHGFYEESYMANGNSAGE